MALIKVYIVKSKISKLFVFRHDSKTYCFIYLVLILFLKR
nr:MAG TPA: hypothetical protein [Bacteriophage sp.]